jgi:hypothetical protein
MEQAIVYLGEGAILVLLGFVLKIATSTRDEMRVLNGRLTGVETWRDVHVKLVDERHENIKERMEDYEEDH